MSYSTSHSNRSPSSDLEQKLLALQKENEELHRLIESKQKTLDLYRQTVNKSPNAIFSIDLQGLITTWNPACIGLFGYDDTILGSHFGRLIPDETKVRFIEEEVMESGEDNAISNLDLVYSCRAGEIKEMVSRIYPVMNSGGAIQGFVFANTDVTERNRIHRELEGYRHHLEEIVEERTAKLQDEVSRRREAQLGLQASYDALVTILNGLDLAIRVVSLGGGELIFANRRLKTLEAEGRSKESGFQLFGTLDDILLSEASTYGVAAALQDDTPERLVPVLERWFLFQERIIDWVTGKPVLLQVAADITERKQIDLEKQRVEKLESLGVLAGGIAHDFNNLLTGIMGSLSLLKFQAEQGVVDRQLIDNAVNASSRATSLTQQLLTFSKGGDPVRTIFDVGKTLHEAVSFSLRGSAVRGVVNTVPGLAYVEADEGQLSHVFHNLVINAKQAMDGEGGLRVTADNCHLQENQLADLRAGAYVRIDFSDSGPGIAPDHIDKVFDPYFTTKPKGEGLGLAMVHTIIRKHQGKVTVRPNSGDGVTFSLYLPASEKQPVMPENAQPRLSEASGRVLLMDDEKSIREVGEAILRHLGYQVTAVEDGRKAIACFKESLEGQPFTLVILDLTIPGCMGGDEVARRIHELEPNVRIIASSGYTDSQVLSEYEKYGFCGVLKKPYRVEEMGDILEKAIYSR